MVTGLTFVEVGQRFGVISADSRLTKENVRII